MAVPDFDTSHNRECMECHRTGFDEGDWQFMGYDDEAELYICPDCQSSAIADDGDLQTRVAEQRNDAETPIPAASSVCSSCGHMDGYHPEWCTADESPLP